ncbi:MAG: hypothetical protein ACRCZD_17725 [Phycicoccus sp.]
MPEVRPSGVQLPDGVLADLVHADVSGRVATALLRPVGGFATPARSTSDD